MGIWISMTRHLLILMYILLIFKTYDLNLLIIFSLIYSSPSLWIFIHKLLRSLLKLILSNLKQAQQRAERHWGKAATPGWQVYSARKLTFEACLGAASEISRFPHPPTKAWKFIKRPSLGSVTCTVQVFSTQHHYPEAVSLEQLLGVGKAGRVHIPRTGIWVQLYFLLSFSS